jgi:hypothetical protein
MALNVFVLSPLTSMVQAALTRRVMLSIYEDIRHSHMGFSLFYKDGTVNDREAQQH